LKKLIHQRVIAKILRDFWEYDCKNNN
jgi:hypothetical protein